METSRCHHDDTDMCFLRSCSSSSLTLAQEKQWQPSIWHQVQSRQADRFRLCGWQCIAQRCTQQSPGHDNKATRAGNKVESAHQLWENNDDVSWDKTTSSSSCQWTTNRRITTICEQLYISRIGNVEVDIRARRGKVNISLSVIAPNLHQHYSQHVNQVTSE